jgi:hypothetical protein
MIETLLQPADCLFLFVDYQAGLAFGVESIAKQAILNNAIFLASTAMLCVPAYRFPTKRPWRAPTVRTVLYQALPSSWLFPLCLPVLSSCSAISPTRSG